MLKLLTMEVRYEHDVVLARQRARTIASFLKFDVQDQTRIATAVSEIARNCFEYGGGGVVEFQIDDGPRRMFLISIRDRGRGIENLDEIMGGKYVSPTGMGLGMIGAKRLMDHFQVQSEAGKGTVVTLGKTVSAKFIRLSDAQLNSLLGTIGTRTVPRKIPTKSWNSRIKSSCARWKNCARGRLSWRSSTKNWTRRTGAWWLCTRS